MHVHDTTPALAAFFLFCGGSAVQAQITPATVASLRRDTSSAAVGEHVVRSRSAAADTTQIDLRAGEPDIDGGGLWHPDFLEFRLLTSRHSSIPSRTSTTQYRDMYILDLHAAWTLTSNDFLSVEYAPGVVPLAISTRNPHAYAPKVNASCAYGTDCEAFSSLSVSSIPRFATTYGFGLTPVGFRMRLFRSSPVQLVTYANGGALWFTRRIPDPEATQFNFTAELGAALQINLPDRLALAVGYSWHHTSNGGTGEVNPGLNSRALALGIVARRQ